ncbi:nitroreductase family deazaflavin-dependent oxidoreductase [Flindersiella endophytica]
MAKPGKLDRALRRAFGRLESWRYRRFGGTTPGMGGHPQLLLTTTGRKSGRERTAPLFYARLGERLVVIASYGGADVHPAWWLNLREAGQGRVELDGETFDVRPALLEGDEREQAWQAMVAFWPAYDDYVRKTSREIPVVALDRIT